MVTFGLPLGEGVIGDWILVIGDGLLVIGDWELVIGDGLLAVGNSEVPAGEAREERLVEW